MKIMDRQNMLGSLQAFPEQIHQAWAEAHRVRISAAYRSIRSIVLFGMGGSAFPANIAKDVFRNELRVPMSVVQDYHLPRFVDRNTLVIASSYSGTTEESVTALHEAHARGAKCLVLAEGGELARLAKRWSIPAYIFTASANPSGQPRMGVGYMLFGTIGLLSAAGQLRLTDAQVGSVVRRVRAFAPRWSENVPFGKNRAQQLARKLVYRVPIIVGSEHLEHAALAFRNRLHENSKHFAEYFPLPALNHHLLEGLGYPKQRLFVIFLSSDRVFERTRRRYAITKRVFSRHGIPSEDIRFTASTALEEVCVQLAFSGYVSFWLAMEHKLDPSPIPWVKYFKAQLAKR